MLTPILVQGTCGDKAKIGSESCGAGGQDWNIPHTHTHNRVTDKRLQLLTLGFEYLVAHSTVSNVRYDIVDRVPEE